MSNLQYAINNCTKYVENVDFYILNALNKASKIPKKKFKKFAKNIYI